jgi:hypothetical protein
MARGNGSNSGAVLDFNSLMQQQNERAARLKELGKRHGDLQKARQQLDKDEAAFMKEVQSLGLGNAFSAPSRPARQPRQTAKAQSKGKGDGNKGKQQSKPQPKAQKRAANGTKQKGNGGNGTRGVPLHNILLTVLPANNEDSITKDEIASRVSGEGYTSKASNPKVVIGQALGASNHFTNTGRGLWKLSKLGERARDKMFASAVSDAAKDTNATAAVSTPAPVAAQPVAAQPVASADTAEDRLAQTNAAAADAQPAVGATA